ncbi:MAG: carboxynorspermidine decarboxylase [Syntrophorhabdaceae bacterium]
MHKMSSEEKIEEALGAITAGDIFGARLYQGLTDDGRLSLLKSIDKAQLTKLTGLIKASRDALFKDGERNFLEIAAGGLRTPVYVIDERLVEENMRILRYVKDRTGCRILHALKAYASFATFGVMTPYLDGVCASGLYEAQLGREEFCKEVHTFSAAYRKDEIRKILKFSDFVIFNSFHQVDLYARIARSLGRNTGVRVNPGYSQIDTPMYDPCAPCSRLGILHDDFARDFPVRSDLIDGLHFHALCEQNSDVLESVVNSFEKLYSPYIKGLKWVNFGGGHHITRPDYDIERLIRLINDFQSRYGVEVYLEPGEASVYHAGVLIARVLDIVKNEVEIAILDTSAEAHMPDVLLMPYRPHVLNSAEPGIGRYTYRLSGPSCLAGDTIGDYSFDAPLRQRDSLIFTDMALYSIVKNTTFNGIGLPDIAVIRTDGTYRVIKRFGYRDYRNRQS